MMKMRLRHLPNYQPLIYISQTYSFRCLKETPHFNSAEYCLKKQGFCTYS